MDFREVCVKLAEVSEAGGEDVPRVINRTDVGEGSPE